MDQQPTETTAEETKQRHELDQLLAHMEVEIGKRLVRIQHTCNAQEASAISDLLAGIQDIRSSLQSKEWSRSKISFRIRQLFRDFGWVTTLGRLFGGPPG